MKIAELESYVKKSYNMTIKDLMIKKLQKDGLIDREVANMLNMSIGAVRKLKKSYGIRKTDFSLKRFEERYGPGSVRRFKCIIEDPSSSLADVGRYFGFTRENARQIYKKIYGLPYTKTYKKKLLLRRLKTDSLKFTSNRLMHLKNVMDKITNIGLDPKILIEAKARVLVTNTNLRVKILHSSKLRHIGNKKYLYVSVLSKYRKDYDFFILSYLDNGNSGYYIIPNEHLPKEGTMIAVSSNNADGKYTRFKDAWDLLVKA